MYPEFESGRRAYGASCDWSRRPPDPATHAGVNTQTAAVPPITNAAVRAVRCRCHAEKDIGSTFGQPQ